MPTSAYKHIAAIVKYHRKNAGLTQNQLATLAGVGKTVVFDIEHDKETIQLQSLIKVFEVLNIRIELSSPLISQYGEDTHA